MLRPNNQQLTDEKLMESFIRERNPSCYAELYRRHFQSVARYISWLIKDENCGKDLAQNVFIHVFNKPELFDPSKNFKVWLFSIAKNRWKNELRNEAVKTKYLNQAAANLQLGVEESDPSQMAHRQQRIQDALLNLSDPQREVVILKYTDNLTLQEISEVIGCSKGTVKSRLFYALQHLRNLVKERP